MHEHQYRVIKHVSQALARRIETSLHEELGKKVRVVFEYAPDLKKAPGAVTVVHVGFAPRPIGNIDREYERLGGGEQFRNAPLHLRAQFLISCWAPAPDDQELLGLVLRTFHDHSVLETVDDEEETVSYDGRPSIEMNILTFEKHKEIAAAYGMPMAPSMSYWVDISVQSAIATPIRRVKERVIDFKKIDG